MSMTRGFTPTQWVIGRSPNQVQSLTGDLFTPTVDTLDAAGEFANAQKKRLAAQTAFIRTDSDAKLRRAMNQNYRQIKDTLVVGQVVYHWREKGAGILQKQKWRGPARVVATEQDNKDRDAVIWLAHGSTTQFKDVYHPELPGEEEEDDIEELDAEHEPEEPGEAGEQPEVDETMLPGIVVPLIRSHARRASGSEPMSRERTPRRESSEPEPAPPSEVSGEAGGPEDGRERKENDRPEPEGVREEKRRRIADPSDVPVPEDIADDDLIIDDITFVDGMDPDVPEGWVMVDGEYELSDAWMVQNLRKTEASEKTVTADEKAQMMQAKMEELENYFHNKVWNFAEVNPGDEPRIVSTRWVLTWKVTENGPKAKARLVLRGYQDPDRRNQRRRQGDWGRSSSCSLCRTWTG